MPTERRHVFARAAQRPARCGRMSVSWDHVPARSGQMPARWRTAPAQRGTVSAERGHCVCAAWARAGAVRHGVLIMRTRGGKSPCECLAERASGAGEGGYHVSKATAQDSRGFGHGSDTDGHGWWTGRDGARTGSGGDDARSRPTCAAFHGGDGQEPSTMSRLLFPSLFLP